MSRLLAVIIILTLMIHCIIAQEMPSNVPTSDNISTEPYELPETLISREQKFAISVNYVFTTVSFSQRGNENKSILTFRDIYFHGAQLNLDIPYAPPGFDGSYISIGYSSSFHGYFTDDDANNNTNQIGVSSVNASLISISYEIQNESNRINPIVGIYFNCIWFEQQNGENYDSMGVFFVKGLVCKYDIYRFGLYGGLDFNLLKGRFGYIKLNGVVGITYYLGLADWVYRNDFKHPVSFFDLGIAFRTGGGLDVAFSLGRFSIFAKAQLLYEISPLGYQYFRLANGNIPSQTIFTEYTHSSLSLGFAVRF